ncbi:holo-ACP synthase [Desulfofundulus thermosubterraneus]|uniref:Holo-[acyl-carrier-protein] synthase n=1 Tax=Desulfofundulus thermosubterraneus DSM 16057 TaxID=1121432 RepID=A0A1M6ANE4_9FIRM|nr:holo-ACP synthase [Desulfofundulus thermosubterraneus]SHI37917.1 holo-[acyl-carrier-protein] synthase [Desulfofundulus thermosubterraneus DSM 16057]
MKDKMERDIRGSICSIGSDMVSVDRIRQAIGKFGERFLARVFTWQERRYCTARRDPCPCYAARFAAKEAVLKALGTGLTAGCSWRNVEIVRDRHGAPGVELHGRAALLARERGIKKFLITLSHDGSYAVAFAVALGD